MRETQDRPAKEDAAGLAPRSAAAVWTRYLAAGTIVAAFAMTLLLPTYSVLAVDAGPDGAASIATTETSSGVTPTDPATTAPSAAATKSVVATTATFARIMGTSVRVHYPALPNKLIAVGFHQADNKKAKRFVPNPSLKCIGIKKARTTKAMLKRNRSLKLFQQPRRGRGTNNFTAADCSVPRNTTVLAPVTGVVTNVRKYKLYGRISDQRLEIKPDGGAKLRVVMIHIKLLKGVKKGTKVVGGKTPVAIVRNLKLNSTIDRFVPAKRVDHVHLQVNTDKFKGSY
jgi:hypothetical protein